MTGPGPLSARRLDAAFPFSSNAPLQRDLKRLMLALEARFVKVEGVTGTFEAEVSRFEQLGLSRLNDVLVPLATEAVNRLQDVSRLFSTVSTTSVTIGVGTHTFLIPNDQWNTYVTTPFLGIYAVKEDPEDLTNGMIAETVSLDRDTGILVVNAVIVFGSGTFSDWEIFVSPAPSLVSRTNEQTDAVIAAAIAALDPTFDLKAPKLSPVFTGTPTAPTPITSDSSDKLATTSFVQIVAAIIASNLVATAIAGIAAPDLDIASVAQVRGATLGSHAITTSLIETANAPVALTDAATIGLDWKNGINFTVTLAGNRTLGNPSNGIPGTWRTLLVTQDSVGTRTLAYGTQYVAVGGVKPVITTGNGKTSRLVIHCRSASVFEVYGFGLGLA